MYASIDNVRDIAAVISFLNIREIKFTLTEYMIEGLKITYTTISLYWKVQICYKLMGQP